MQRMAIVLAIVLTCAALPFHAQPSRPALRFTLLDIIVFSASLPFDMSVYPADLRSLLRQHMTRWKAYRPRQRPPKVDPESEMGYDAREGYERRLAAVTTAPDADTLAQQYVDSLRPCYEWEGFHDCPEAEAKFAEQYLSKNPNNPFAEFLPLLAAHRWICAAEGYELEERPGDAVRARRAAEGPLATALKSPSLLIRTAAQELRSRNRCHGAAP